MRILVIGSGAREHVFVRAFLKSGHSVFAAPGNPGMEADGAKCYYDFRVENIRALCGLAIALRVDLTVVGPELPLSLGIVDRFQEEGMPIVGPTKDAARLESSKAQAKEFMQRHHIPTARFDVCHTAEEALSAADKRNGECAVKANGLAEGKAVVVCDTMTEAEAAIQKLMTDRAYGTAGDCVVIEDKLVGRECSFIVLSDGINVVRFRKARDWKRRFDGDRGPNTGGVGGQCPVYEEDAGLDQLIMDTIVMPTIRGMAQEGHLFQGFLYVGLMLTADGPQVIEFNVRMGDPEASVILTLLETDLADLLLRSTFADGLKNITLKWRDGVALCVVMVSGGKGGGYPGHYEKGFPISGIHEAEDETGCLVFHANTAKKSGHLVTAGGRVLDVVGIAPTLEEALAKVYNGIHRINFEHCAYRGDIGQPVAT